jgi:hypothetical protein
VTNPHVVKRWPRSVPLAAPTLTTTPSDDDGHHHKTGAPPLRRMRTHGAEHRRDGHDNEPPK